MSNPRHPMIEAAAQALRDNGLVLGFTDSTRGIWLEDEALTLKAATGAVFAVLDALHLDPFEVLFAQPVAA